MMAIGEVIGDESTFCERCVESYARLSIRKGSVNVSAIWNHEHVVPVLPKPIISTFMGLDRVLLP